MSNEFGLQLALIFIGALLSSVEAVLFELKLTEDLKDAE